MGGSVNGPEPWSNYLPWRDAFHAMLDPALYPAAWLDGEVACGRMLLFSTPDAAILASVKTYPSGLKELEGQAATGKLSDIVGNLIPASLRWAQSIGCKSAVIESRKGWVKMLPDFKVHQTRIRKVL